MFTHWSSHLHAVAASGRHEGQTSLEPLCLFSSLHHRTYPAQPGARRGESGQKSLRLAAEFWTLKRPTALSTGPDPYLAQGSLPSSQACSSPELRPRQEFDAQRALKC